MKVPNTSTIEVRKKAIEFDLRSYRDIGLFQIVAITFLISILSILLYEKFLLWSIGIAVVSIGVVRIYSWYKELVELDWSIDLSDFTMEDVMADLENNSYTIYNLDKTQKTQMVHKQQKVDSVAL